MRVEEIDDNHIYLFALSELVELVEKRITDFLHVE